MLDAVDSFVFIAHLPAGYLLTRVAARGRPNCLALALGLFGSVAPDLDLLYFYTIDGRQHLHHGYWTHIPAYWLGFALAIAVVGLYRPLRPLTLHLLRYFIPNVLLHLLLDSVASEVRWLFPLSGADYGLIDVPARYSHWILNFVLHWSFVAELLIVGVAARVFVSSIASEPRRT